MNITDVRIRRIDNERKLRAVASVTYDDEFVIHDIKVIEGQSGFFIAMPSRRTADGDYRDIAHPITSEAREKLQSYVLGKYNELINQE